MTPRTQKVDIKIATDNDMGARVRVDNQFNINIDININIQYYIDGNVKSSCHVRVETENRTVAKEFGFHIHADIVAKITGVALRVACQRQTSEDTFRHFSKIIRIILQSNVAGNMTTSRHVMSYRAVVYRQRRKQSDQLPFTSYNNHCLKQFKLQESCP
jgi:hypothetical protein